MACLFLESISFSYCSLLKALPKASHLLGAKSATRCFTAPSLSMYQIDQVSLEYKYRTQSFLSSVGDALVKKTAQAQ